MQCDATIGFWLSLGKLLCVFEALEYSEKLENSNRLEHPDLSKRRREGEAIAKECMWLKYVLRKTRGSAHSG
jgi:hypothetical protein